jgi:Uma2 family endonuclease
MADNPKQFRWIFVLYGNLAAQYRDSPEVLVGGNQFWYPREGHPDLKQAPGVYVVFGRPRGDRPSYRQWEEDDVPMSVVFEVLSPSNDSFEMADKLAFYDEHGAEEYYVYDPDANRLLAYQRGRQALRLIRHDGTYTSPRLGVRFDTTGPEMVVCYPDGQRFLTFEELKKAQEDERRGRLLAEQRAADAEQRAARLIVLGRKARQGEATAEELAELERLEDECNPPD